MFSATDKQEPSEPRRRDHVEILLWYLRVCGYFDVDAAIVVLSVVTAADPKRRARVDGARAAIKAVQTEIANTLPGDVGVTLGFNTLDGD